jgi:hypothetical protein
MPTRTCLIVAALFALGLGVIDTALAQTAPPAQAAVPEPACDKPGDPPRVLTTETGREASERKRNDWAKSMKAYVECLKRFIEDERAAAAPHIKAANAAVDEYSKAIKTFNDQAEAAARTQ